MTPGPANVLSCPFCGGTKEVMSLISGNTCGATVWSDTRRYYPMLPEVSPIQECPHCHKFYFIEQAKHTYSDDPESTERSYGKLGKLTFLQLIKAKKQMDCLSLTKMQRWILNHQIFMAYNDCFRREPENVDIPPSQEEQQLYLNTIDELLDGIGQSANYQLFHAELLREVGKFDEAREILLNHKSEDDKWIVEAMLKHIEHCNTAPFLLVENGILIK